jgi:putative transposase
MDEPYLLAPARYLELDLVRVGLARDASDWRWSSARAHLAGRDDRLVRVAPMMPMVANWRGLGLL